jgi:RNA recognition motif-containing protein
LLKRIHRELAISHLNGAPLFGRTLAVGQSKHATVQLPPRGTEMLDGRPLFQDYTDSKLLRFRGNPPSKIFANISPPTPVVHVANLPATATEEEIRQLFSQYGTVQDFRFFPTKTAKRQICSEDKRMALVQMRSTSEAVDALVCLHNYSFNGNNIRLSFSKSLPAMWNTPEGRALRDQMRAQVRSLSVSSLSLSLSLSICLCLYLAGRRRQRYRAASSRRAPRLGQASRRTRC